MYNSYLVKSFLTSGDFVFISFMIVYSNSHVNVIQSLEKIKKKNFTKWVRNKLAA